MKLQIIILLFTTLTTMLCDTCDYLGTLLYEDLGCYPHYNGTSLCPYKYSCEGLEPFPNYCYFKGRAYKIEETVEDELVDPSCSRACYCSDYKESPSFSCAVLDCPEWLGTPPDPDCYREFSLDSCCSSGTICPPFDDLATCYFDGRAYKEGESFFPEDSCVSCVCQRSFDGRLEEPFCRRRSCGVQLKYGEELSKGCVPWYGEEFRGVLCCPYNFICPEGFEEVQGEKVSDDTCIFGHQVLKVGQFFERFDVEDNFGTIVEKVRCECIIPPLLTCIDAL